MVFPEVDLLLLLDFGLRPSVVAHRIILRIFAFSYSESSMPMDHVSLRSANAKRGLAVANVIGSSKLFLSTGNGSPAPNRDIQISGF